MIALLLGSALSLWLSSCGGPSREGVAQSSQASGTAPTDDPSPTTAPTPPLVDDGLPPATSTDPVTAATTGLQTWARRDLAYAQWWQDLEPLMSAQGRQDYASTDPAEIPAMTVTGPAAVFESAPTSALVTIPTSIGPFGVRLTRTSPAVGWLVSRFYFPPAPVPGATS